MKKNYLLALLFLFTSQGYALDLNKTKKEDDSKSATSVRNNSAVKKEYTQVFYLGFDSYARSLYKTTSSNSATQDAISPLQYPLSFIYSYSFTPHMRLFSQINYTVFSKKGEDGNTEESHLMWRIPYVQSFGGSNLSWKAGLLWHQETIRGKGGTTVLNNGTGTASFALPDRTQTTNIISNEFGLTYDTDSWQWSASFLVDAPLSSTKRNISLLAGLVYKIGGF